MHEVEDTQDATEKQILSDVEEHGFFVALFEGDEYSPSFGYTIGLFKTHGYPELVCFGLSHEVLHSLFWTAKQLFDNHPKPDLAAAQSDFLEDYDVRLLQVDKAWYHDYFGYGKWFHQSWDFPVLQIVWPDNKGQFPWETDFNAELKFRQPLLDRNTDFKFREERNVAVFTTRQVLEGLPILRVSHDAEGDWQFLCTTTTDVADLKIVALSEIVRRDPSVNTLHELGYNWAAWRESPEASWETWEQEANEDSEE